jgi:hypothetical protein
MQKRSRFKGNVCLASSTREHTVNLFYDPHMSYASSSIHEQPLVLPHSMQR